MSETGGGEEIFKQALAESIMKFVPDAKKISAEGKPNKNIAESISEIRPENLGNSIKAIDLVIDAIESGGETLTLENVDKALDASDELVKWAKKDATREKNEAENVNADLGIGEKIFKFVGGKSDRINNARKQAKEADKATGNLEKSRDQNTELDSAIDNLITSELSEVSPSFALVLEAEKDIDDVLSSLDKVTEAADSLDSAGVNDMIDPDLGNAASNAGLELLDNLAVEDAKQQIEQAISELNRALKKFEGLNFETISTEFIDLVNMLDIPLDIMETSSSFGAGDALDMIGAMQTMSEAGDLSDNAEKMRGNFQKRLDKIEKSIALVVSKIRKDLKIE